MSQIPETHSPKPNATAVSSATLSKWSSVCLSCAFSIFCYFHSASKQTNGPEISSLSCRDGKHTHSQAGCESVCILIFTESSHWVQCSELTQWKFIIIASWLPLATRNPCSLLQPGSAVIISIPVQTLATFHEAPAANGWFHNICMSDGISSMFSVTTANLHWKLATRAV